MPSERAIFRSLHVRSYRLYAIGQLISTNGTWMARIGQDWLVLDLSGDDPVALGTVTALQFVPMLVLSLWGGVLADRYAKRSLLVGIQSGLLVAALTLALLDAGGVVALWHVYALSLVMGIFSALEMPARHAFAGELVGSAEVPNAVALNSLTLHAARVTGPAIAGVVIARSGTAPVFAVNVATFAVVIVALLAIRPGDLHTSPRSPRAKGQVRDGIRYVRGRPDLVLALGLIFVVGTFGMNFEVALAPYVKGVLDREASAYGLLYACLATGSVLGALVAARRRQPATRRFLLGTAVAFGIIEVVAANVPSYTTLAIVLVPQGIAVLAMMNSVSATLQLTTDVAMRGRVMGLYALAFQGGTPIGALTMGWIGDRFGGRAPLLAGGVTCILGAMVLASTIPPAPSRSTLAGAGSSPQPFVQPEQGHSQRGRVAGALPAPASIATSRTPHSGCAGFPEAGGSR